MAADVWRVKDMYGRIYIYESEKLFIRRFKLSIGDYEDRITWMAQHPNGSSYTPKVPEGHRIENDVWVAQQLDKEMIREYLRKRQSRVLRREARSRGYKY